MTRRKLETFATSWRLLRARLGEEVFLVRVNDAVSPFLKDRRFKTLLQVRIYRDKSGVPSDAEMKELNAAEKLLKDTLCRGGLAVWTLFILDRRGLAFVFYIKGREEALARMRSLRKSIKTHPFSFFAEPDPDWKLYHRYADPPSEHHN